MEYFRRVREDWNLKELIVADKAHSWHPFTQMRDWCQPDYEPLLLVSGEGAILRDARGHEYLDGNSSIWTNVHGHCHPTITAAIKAQLDHVAHVSFLGTTNVPATMLAQRLTELFPPDTLTRVFFSDDGSTAIEVAAKMARQYFQQSHSAHRTRFVAFRNAYHGDTLGAASLGGIGIFQAHSSAEFIAVSHVRDLEELVSLPFLSDVAAVIIEPLIQGAAGMRLWPKGMLKSLREVCTAHGILLILDEVMTGFGRTGTLFACEQEDVIPDFLCLAKGLTGGYLPLAATLTTEAIFSEFLGTAEEHKTLYYGHSYTGNPLGCAAALASLDIFDEENVLANLQPKIAAMRTFLAGLRDSPHVFEIRQCGFMAGIEVRDAAGVPFPWQLRTGARICEAARRHGLLTRPILDTIVLMPPLCTTISQLEDAVCAVALSITEVCGGV